MKTLEAILAGLACMFIVPNCPAVHKDKIIVKTMTVTAYCPCRKCTNKDPNHPTYRTTKNGYKIQQGDKLAAADKSIPFGTLIDIPGYGTVPVLDRGGAITGDRLDVFFDSHKEAEKWGVQILEVGILK
jgi:3D (Asp-Asp-Asp) domain-containing protein